jgi:hypothetical protein
MLWQSQCVRRVGSAAITTAVQNLFWENSGAGMLAGVRVGGAICDHCRKMKDRDWRSFINYPGLNNFLVGNIPS